MAYSSGRIEPSIKVLQDEIANLKNRLDREISTNERSYERIDKRLAALEADVKVFAKRLGALEAATGNPSKSRAGNMEQLENPIPATNSRQNPRGNVSAPLTVRNPRQGIIASPVAASPENALRQALQDYKKINQSGASGFDLKTARDSFIKKHNVLGFNCVNYEDRMSNPSLPPRFATAESPVKGNYWAVPTTENGYCVFPNPKLDYEARIHYAGGMRESFESGFQGGAYTNFEVEMPAMFIRSGNTWKIRSKGRLKLLK